MKPTSQKTPSKAEIYHIIFSLQYAELLNKRYELLYEYLQHQRKSVFGSFVYFNFDVEAVCDSIEYITTYPALSLPTCSPANLSTSVWKFLLEKILLKRINFLEESINEIRSDRKTLGIDTLPDPRSKFNKFLFRTGSKGNSIFAEERSFHASQDIEEAWEAFLLDLKNFINPNGLDSTSESSFYYDEFENTC